MQESQAGRSPRQTWEPKSRTFSREAQSPIKVQATLKSLAGKVKWEASEIHMGITPGILLIDPRRDSLKQKQRKSEPICCKPPQGPDAAEVEQTS